MQEPCSGRSFEGDLDVYLYGLGGLCEKDWLGSAVYGVCDCESLGPTDYFILLLNFRPFATVEGGFCLLGKSLGGYVFYPHIFPRRVVSGMAVLFSVGYID